MAEMERLKADEKTFKAFATLEATSNHALEKAFAAVEEIQKLSSDAMDIS
jgi:hypothetical protein